MGLSVVQKIDERTSGQCGTEPDDRIAQRAVGEPVRHPPVVLIVIRIILILRTPAVRLDTTVRHETKRERNGEPGWRANTMSDNREGPVEMTPELQPFGPGICFARIRLSLET